MSDARRVHDHTMLDAMDALTPESFAGDVWRITGKGRDALRGSTAHGRWSPNGAFEVLYTSLERTGALAEIGYRLSLEPIWPSRLMHEIHHIAAETERTLRFANVTSLAPLGVDVARHERFDYAATQAIAAAAHFLELDGLVVPSARASCANLVIFPDRLGDGATLMIKQSEPVNWDDWRK